jgi:hypothetical protein
MSLTRLLEGEGAAFSEAGGCRLMWRDIRQLHATLLQTLRVARLAQWLGNYSMVRISLRFTSSVVFSSSHIMSSVFVVVLAITCLLGLLLRVPRPVRILYRSLLALEIVLASLTILPLPAALVCCLCFLSLSLNSLWSTL